MAKFSEATKRDIETMKDGCRELWRDVHSPLFWIGLAIITFFLAAPWLFEPGDLPW